MSATAPLLVALGLAVLLAGVALARAPLAAVAVVPAGAGVAVVPIPGLPVPLLVAHALALLAIAGVCAHAVLHPRSGKLRLPSPYGQSVMGLTLLFGAVVGVSAVVGLDPVRFAGVTISTLLGIAYALCVIIVVRDSRDVVVLLGAFAFGAVTATAPALQEGGNVTSEFGGAVVEGRATGAFGDPNELGVFSALGLVLSLTFAATARSRWGRSAGVLAAVVTLGSLLVSYSRLSWIAAPVGLLVLALHAPARRLMVRTGPPLLALGVTLLLVIGVRFPLQSFVQRLASLGGSANPDDVRVQAWHEAFRLIWERPLIGWGPGSFEELAETPPSVIWAAPVNHPHNGLLTVLVEQGFTGALVMSALAVAIVVRLVGTIARRHHPVPLHRSLAFGCLAGLALLTVNLAADYQLRNPYVMLTVWFLAGISVAVGDLAVRPGARAAAATSQPPAALPSREPTTRRVPLRAGGFTSAS